MGSYVKFQDEEAPIVSGDGWTTEQALEQQAKWGKHEIPEEKEPLWKMFAMQFVGTMPFMIEGAALLSASLGSWLDFWIIVSLLMYDDQRYPRIRRGDECAGFDLCT